MLERIRAFDWASTPLGSMSAWPERLRSIVDLVLASPQPSYLAWGPELIAIYNDGYIPILGRKHPRGLGQPYAALFAEVWHEARPSSRRRCGERDSASSIGRFRC
jgi:hypothetical protein